MSRLKVFVGALLALALMALPAAAMAAPGDRDNDRLPDRWELKHGISPNKKSTSFDPDHDGLTNLGELKSGTHPRDADSDNDHREDSDEDADRDRVDNENEMDEGTRPRDPDTDDDGRGDGREDPDHDGLSNSGEDGTGMDPDNPDTDDDGIKDGDEHAGVVTSFEEDFLTIALANGSSVRGLVTDDTEIECESEDEYEDGNADPHDGYTPERLRALDEGGEDSEEPGSGEEGSDESGEDQSGDDESDDQGEDEDEDENEGDDDYDHGHDGDRDDRCSPSDLVAGTRVHEAELKVTGDGLVFTEIELVK